MRLFTDAVKAHLETNTNGYKIGDAVAPKNADVETEPYAVLYPMDEDGSDGDYENTQRTGWYEYQVTVVGESRVQAEGFADELRALILSAVLTPAGFRMAPWEKIVTQNVQRDDDVQPPIFYLIFTVTGFVAPT